MQKIKLLPFHSGEKVLKGVCIKSICDTCSQGQVLDKQMLGQTLAWYGILKYHIRGNQEIKDMNHQGVSSIKVKMIKFKQKNLNLLTLFFFPNNSVILVLLSVLIVE